MIPIRNIWVLMFYASDLCLLHNKRSVSIEERPEDILNIVAEILCKEVEARIRFQLNSSFHLQERELTKVRGKIDILKTERKYLLDKGKVHCRFDELSMDIPRYRYVLAALDYLRLHKGLSLNLKRKCKQLSSRLEMLGISKDRKIRYTFHPERLRGHDYQDSMMIHASTLIFELSIPTEEGGYFLIGSPNSQNEHWLRALFEKAMIGFFRFTLSSDWLIESKKKLLWPLENQTDQIDAIFPSMEIDIRITSKASQRYLIVDTKFNSILKKGWYRKDTLRSGYIYQIYSYLRSQEVREDAVSCTSIGMLLHPSVDLELTEMVEIQDHPVIPPKNNTNHK